MWKTGEILSVALYVCTVSSTVALGAHSLRHRQIDRTRADGVLQAASGAEHLPGLRTGGQEFGSPVALGSFSSGSPGFQVGTTTFDYQHNGSTGRQVDHRNGTIQVAWMYSDEFSLASGRNVRWNKATVVGNLQAKQLDNGDTVTYLPIGPPTGSADGVTVIAGGNRPGYTTFRNLPSGRGVVFAHDAPEPPDPGPLYWFAGVDASTAVGVFIQNNAPQPSGQGPGDEVIWPHGCTDVVGPDTVLHVVGSQSGTQVVDYPIFYWRGVLSGTLVSWSSPVLIDTVSLLSVVVEADPNSHNVAVVYSKPRQIGTQVDNDVAYRRSSDGGLTWSGVVNVTNYTDSSLDRAYVDIDAVYDEDGTLHIIWPTLDFRPGDGTYFLPCDLWHWDDVLKVGRVISTATWTNTCDAVFGGVRGGTFNLQFAKPNIVVKPAGAHDMAEELLYAVWVQFGPPNDTTVVGLDTLIGDCATQDSTGALRGQVNGEIWCSTSSNNGLTWDRPVNLTGTQTPNCLPGDCSSEHWLTAAARADSAIYLSYVEDTHAGGIVRDDPVEGAWSTSPYRVYAVEARAPVSQPRISIDPLSYTELNVAPGESDTRTLTVKNLGNADLTFDIAVTNDNGGATHVLVNGGGSYGHTIPAAGAPEVVTITYDGIGLPDRSEHDWRLSVTSNDELNDPSQGGVPIEIVLNVFVADPWFSCTSDTLSTGQHRFAVGSCLELGNQGGGGGLYHYGGPSEWIFDASPIIARLDGTTRLAYRDIFWNSLADRSRDSNQAFRAQSPITVIRDTTVNGKGADQASGIATTTDSLIQIDWLVTAFRELNLANGVVVQYTITNRTDTTFDGIMLGAAVDLDVDPVTNENDGIADDAAQYVGAQGGSLDPTRLVFTPQDNYAAVFYVPLDAACADLGQGGQVLDNEDYVYAEDAYNTDSLYNVMSTTVGWNAATSQADTITDVSVVMTSGKNYTLAPADTLAYAIGLAVSYISESDLRATISFLRHAVNNTCPAGCPIILTGDVNLSNTISSADIIVLVNFVFKAGTAPLPCSASGDVNCTGTITAADIVGLVNFVFRAGSPPCDACISPLADEC